MIITINDYCFSKKIRPLLQSGHTYQRLFIQLGSLLKGCSKYFRYLNMHFSVFHDIVQKQKKYLKKLAPALLSDLYVPKPFFCCQFNLFS